LQPNPRILVADANRAVAGEMRRILEGAGMEVEAADSLEAGLQRVRHATFDVVVSAVGSLDGEQLCRRAKEINGTLQVVLLFEPGDERGLEERVEAAHADGYLVGPIRKGSFVSCVRWALRTAELAQKAAGLEAGANQQAELAFQSVADGPGAADMEFFKRLLPMEVKRARRYHFPLSFLMIGVDRFREAVEMLDSHDQAKVVGRLAAAVVEDVRGVDLCVLFAEDRLLLYLPHTGRAGAQQVAERLRDKLKQLEGPQLTVSVGISAYEGDGTEVSFGGLLKESSANLKLAQEKGGDRVVGGPEVPASSGGEGQGGGGEELDFGDIF
jgi:diguanylate cyclase (GGDEF)-like protein